MAGATSFRWQDKPNNLLHKYINQPKIYIKNIKKTVRKQRLKKTKKNSALADKLCIE